MLLQTNSYIVPKDKRAEHARLLRRFRAALAKLGCDSFEVYEQVGSNWSTGEPTGRYVQIMRFRDRRHQLAVQAAERSDGAAQAIIAEFCQLINFPYQQQQGLFAVGFYNSVLPVAPSRPQPGDAEGAAGDATGAGAALGAAAPGFGTDAEAVEAAADEDSEFGVAEDVQFGDMAQQAAEPEAFEGGFAGEPAGDVPLEHEPAPEAEEGAPAAEAEAEADAGEQVEVPGTPPADGALENDDLPVDGTGQGAAGPEAGLSDDAAVEDAQPTAPDDAPGDELGALLEAHVRDQENPEALGGADEAANALDAGEHAADESADDLEPLDLSDLDSPDHPTSHPAPGHATR